MSAKDTVVATKEVPAPPRQSRFSLRAPRDPGFAALRRAARAAIVIPLAFALGTFVLHLGQNVIFIVFGCFALLVITDFGGLRPARARAYLTATAVRAGDVMQASGEGMSAHGRPRRSAQCRRRCDRAAAADRCRSRRRTGRASRVRRDGEASRRTGATGPRPRAAADRAAADRRHRGASLLSVPRLGGAAHRRA